MRFIFLSLSFFSLILNSPLTSADEKNRSSLPTLAEPSPERVLSFREFHVDPFLFRAFDRTSILTLVAGGLSVGVTNRQDDSIQSQWINHQKMSVDMAHAGDLLGTGLWGLSAMGLQYAFDSDENNWISHARALVWSTLASSSMKVTFRRQRPGNSDSYHSFPSGHTTTAFATATSLAYSYGWKGAAWAYPVAIWVGLSRLSDNVHWGSDVVAGAFIGFWTARASYYSRSQAQSLKYEKNMDYTWTPVIHSDYYGVNYSLNF